MRKQILFLLALSLLCISFTFAQNNVQQRKIDSEFLNAVHYYENKDYDKALTGFDNVINNYPLNSKTTASYFFRIKILIGQKEFERAKDLTNYFIETYPSSRYIDEIRMLKVKLYVDDSEYFDALKEIAFLIDRTKSISYRIEAKTIGGQIAKSYLSSSDLLRLSNAFTGETVKPYLLLLLGKAFLKEGKKGDALNSFTRIIGSYPHSAEYFEAKSLIESPVSGEETSSGQALVGVLLPLKLNSAGEPTSNTAGEILDGIKYAVAKFNSGRTDKIGIVIRDTQNNEERIKQIRNEIGYNPNIKAIIGPIFSNEVRIAINDFDATGIPIISPTATDNDLTSESENFFQANPPLVIRGKIMAQYIFFVANKRLMAVLNSVDGYSPLLAATFVDEFSRLGGTIVTRQTYKSNSLSFAEQFANIAIADSVDGIYVPLAEKSDAPAILSQMVQDSMYVPLFGNQDWFFAKGFETSPELSNMLTFSSDFFIEFNSKDFQEFNNEFSNITGKDVNRNILYGYDTAKYLLTVMKNVDKNRTAIKTRMISGLTTRGYHNNISFDKHRMNRFLNIVRFKDGVFELIERFRSGSL